MSRHKDVKKHHGDPWPDKSQTSRYAAGARRQCRVCRGIIVWIGPTLTTSRHFFDIRRAGHWRHLPGDPTGAVEREQVRIRKAIRISHDSRPIFAHVDARSLIKVLRGEDWEQPV